MSSGGSISRRYARALLELGLENKKLQGMLKEIERIADAISTSNELRDALRNPTVLPSQRKSILDALAQKLGVSKQIRNTCMLLVERGRASLLPDIAREFQKMVDEYEGVVRAEVVSASTLEPSYVDRLKSALQKATGKKVELTSSEDQDLIGGVVTRVGHVVYDGSLRARISRVREQMLR